MYPKLNIMLCPGRTASGCPAQFTRVTTSISYKILLIARLSTPIGVSGGGASPPNHSRYVSPGLFISSTHRAHTDDIVASRDDIFFLDTSCSETFVEVGKSLSYLIFERSSRVTGGACVDTYLASERNRSKSPNADVGIG